MNTLDKIKALIKTNWVVTDETTNRLYFKHNNLRGAPKFYLDKHKLEVIRVDASKESSKEAIEVEVKTLIMSLIDDDIQPVTAQEVFENRHAEYIKELVGKFGTANSNLVGEDG